MVDKKDIDLGICEDMVRPQYQRMNGLIYSSISMIYDEDKGPRVLEVGLYFLLTELN